MSAVVALSDMEKRWLSGFGNAAWGGNLKITVQRATEDELKAVSVWRSTGILPTSCPRSRAIATTKAMGVAVAGGGGKDAKLPPPCLDCPHSSREPIRHTFEKHNGATYLAEPNRVYYWVGSRWSPYKLTVANTAQIFRLKDYGGDVLVDTNGVSLEQYDDRTRGRALFTADVDPHLLRLGVELRMWKEGFCGARNCCKLLCKVWWRARTDDYRASVLKSHPAFAKRLQEFDTSSENGATANAGEFSDYE